MRSKLPGTIYAQAENIRLPGRDVKASHRWSSSSLEDHDPMESPLSYTLGNSISDSIEKGNISFAFRLSSITLLLKLICSL